MALADLTIAVQLKADDSSAYVQRGRIRARTLRWDEALADFQCAVACRPELARELQREVAEIRLNRAKAFLDAGRADRAVADYEAAIPMLSKLPIGVGPAAAEAFAQRAKRWMDTNNSAKALADLDRAIELDPKVLSGLDRKAATLYVDRARAQIIENKVSSALADLGRALEPIVYIGPAEALPRPNWRLKPPAELLDLKICDPAVGSGAIPCPSVPLPRGTPSRSLGQGGGKWTRGYCRWGRLRCDRRLGTTAQ